MPRQPVGTRSEGPPTPTTRRERKKAQAREHIYSEALRLFRARGYDQTTVQDIADAADTAKGTFFAYFPTKEHVLVEYHQRMGRDILQSVEGHRFTSSENAIQVAVREGARQASRDPVIGRLIIRVILGSDILLHSDEQNEAMLVAWMRSQLRQGIRSGELTSNLDISLFLSLVLDALSSTVIAWLTQAHNFDLERRLRRKVTFLFRAAVR